MKKWLLWVLGALEGCGFYSLSPEEQEKRYKKMPFIERQELAREAVHGIKGGPDWKKWRVLAQMAADRHAEIAAMVAEALRQQGEREVARLASSKNGEVEQVAAELLRRQGDSGLDWLVLASGLRSKGIKEGLSGFGPPPAVDELIRWAKTDVFVKEYLMNILYASGDEVRRMGAGRALSELNAINAENKAEDSELDAVVNTAYRNDTVGVRAAIAGGLLRKQRHYLPTRKSRDKLLQDIRSRLRQSSYEYKEPDKNGRLVPVYSSDFESQKDKLSAISLDKIDILLEQLDRPEFRQHIGELVRYGLQRGNVRINGIDLQGRNAGFVVDTNNCGIGGLFFSGKEKGLSCVPYETESFEWHGNPMGQQYLLIDRFFADLPRAFSAVSFNTDRVDNVHRAGPSQPLQVSTVFNGYDVVVITPIGLSSRECLRVNVDFQEGGYGDPPNIDLGVFDTGVKWEGPDSHTIKQK
jgi:hypothetical protein